MPKYGGGQILPIYPQFVKTSCLTVQAINRVGLTIYNTDASTPVFKVDTSTSTVTLNGTLSGTTMRLSLIDGTVSNPALKFQNSTTSGLYLSAANQISVAILGAEAFRWDASGNTTVLGNLIVNGTSTTVNSSVVNVSDNIINVGSGNVADSLDLGMCFQYVSSGTKYGALYRASGTDNWYLKNAISSAPGNTVSGGTLANLYVGKIVPTSFQMATGAASSYVLASDGSGNGTWTAVSALGVSSLTGTSNQVIVSGATGAVTLSTPQSIGTASTPQFGRLGLGTASTSNVGLLINPTFSTSSSIGNALSITGGTITVTESNSGMKNINSTSTVLATGALGSVSLFYTNIHAGNSLITKTGDGIFSTAYGVYSDGFVSIANSQYAGYFMAPSGGSTNNTALFATNLSVGSYGTTTPPSNGAIISGNVCIASSDTTNYRGQLQITSATGSGMSINAATTSDTNYIYFGRGTNSTLNSKGQVWYNHSTDMMGFATANGDRMYINSSGQVGIGGGAVSPYMLSVNGAQTIIGTLTAAATDTQALYITPIIATSGTTNLNASLGIYPAMRPTGGTVASAYGLLIHAGDQSGAVGTITTGYGLYVVQPNFGTNKTTIYCGGELKIPCGNTYVRQYGLYTGSGAFPGDFCITNNYNYQTGAIDHASYGTSAIVVDSGQSGVPSYISLQTGGVNAAPSNRLQISSTGLMGFNTTAGTYAYNFNCGSATYATAFMVTGTGADMAINIYNSGTSGKNYAIMSTNSGSGAGGGCLRFYDATASADRMIITSTGQFAHGTVSPASVWFHTVAPSTSFPIGLLVAGSVKSVGGANDGVGLYVVPIMNGTTSGTANLKGAYIAPTYVAGAGTTAYFMGLHVDGSQMSGSGTAPTSAYALYVNTPAYGTSRYCAYFEGRVGIGTSTTIYQLELSENLAGKPASNLWTVTSDRRVKANIQDVPLTECMDLINGLRIRSFGYHPIYAAACKIPDAERYGLIAQEVEEVAPYCINTVPHQKYTHPETGEVYEIENLKTLDADELNYAVMGSVQYLYRELLSAKSEIQTLQAELARIATLIPN